jgi:hypothetical protein
MNFGKYALIHANGMRFKEVLTMFANDLELNGHRAQDCPARINVQAIDDPDPIYVHGDCLHLKGGLEHDD